MLVQQTISLWHKTKLDDNDKKIIRMENRISTHKGFKDKSHVTHWGKYKV